MGPPCTIRANDLSRGTGMIGLTILIRLRLLVCLFGFSFLIFFIHPVKNSCSRHEIGNTITYSWDYECH